MPLDPKYAGLPGIAEDQPDMFETVPGMDIILVVIVFSLCVPGRW